MSDSSEDLDSNGNQTTVDASFSDDGKGETGESHSVAMETKVKAVKRKYTKRKLSTASSSNDEGNSKCSQSSSVTKTRWAISTPPWRLEYCYGLRMMTIF